MKIPLNLPLQRETFHFPLLKRGKGDFSTNMIVNPIQQGETDFDVAPVNEVVLLFEL
jgi:hypothetical protein